MKQKPHKSPFHILIRQASGAPLKDLGMIENIMREDIFHSTLDWQTREQLSCAARQAFDLLNENRDMYEFSRVSAMAAFTEMRATETNH